jgi:hypothetical protein
MGALADKRRPAGRCRPGSDTPAPRRKHGVKTESPPRKRPQVRKRRGSLRRACGGASTMKRAGRQALERSHLWASTVTKETPPPISAPSSRATHNVTPGGYRTALLSDSPAVFVMRVVGSGEPDAKPVCGTPRAGRSAAALAPFFDAHHEGNMVVRSTLNEGPALGRARGTSNSELPNPTGAAAHASKKQTNVVLSRAALSTAQHDEPVEPAAKI